MRHISSDFYIMKAAHLTSSGRKLGLRKIMRDEPNCTIIVATRHYSWDKAVPCFIIGAQDPDRYGVEAGDKCTYTIDTGNGYRNQGNRLDIEGVIQVVDGAVVGELPDFAAQLDPGPGDKLAARYTYVMK